MAHKKLALVISIYALTVLSVDLTAFSWGKPNSKSVLEQITNAVKTTVNQGKNLIKAHPQMAIALGISIPIVTGVAYKKRKQLTKCCKKNSGAVKSAGLALATFSTLIMVDKFNVVSRLHKQLPKVGRFIKNNVSAIVLATAGALGMSIYLTLRSAEAKEKRVQELLEKMLQDKNYFDEYENELLKLVPVDPHDPKSIIIYGSQSSQLSVVGIVPAIKAYHSATTDQEKLQKKKVVQEQFDILICDSRENII